MIVRTPGRRCWETHLLIRVGTGIALALLASSVWFLYGRIRLLESPHNPHYEVTHCFDCHEQRGSKMTAADCFECHDSHSRELLPGAVARRKLIGDKECTHPLKIVDSNAGRTVTQLCLGCHSAVNGYVAMANIADGTYVEIDISRTHPIGLQATETIYPKTLPTSTNGSIDCITCHDPHAQDKRMHLLRYYYPGNGRPPDFRPLCNDCHSDGWMPLRLKHTDVVRKAQRPH